MNKLNVFRRSKLTDLCRLKIFQAKQIMPAEFTKMIEQLICSF